MVIGYPESHCAVVVDERRVERDVHYFGCWSWCCIDLERYCREDVRVVHCDYSSQTIVRRRREKKIDHVGREEGDGRTIQGFKMQTQDGTQTKQSNP